MHSDDKTGKKLLMDHDDNAAVIPLTHYDRKTRLIGGATNAQPKRQSTRESALERYYMDH